MQQKFTPFSPFQPQTKFANHHGINNITISQGQKKAKPKRGNSRRMGRAELDRDEGNRPGINNIINQHGQTKGETQARESRTPRFIPIESPIP
jgi:hypothetical protein